MYSFSSSSSRTLVISISSSKCSSSSCIMANLLAGTRAQCTVLIQQLLQLVYFLHLVDAPSIRRRLREALEVESEVLAHLLDSNDLPLESDLAVDMLLHDPEPLINSGLARTPVIENIVYLLEDPRIPESCPPYHHVVGYSVVEKPLRVLSLLDTPVRNDWYGRLRLCCSDDIPVLRARTFLHSGTAMNRKSCYTVLLTNGQDFLGDVIVEQESLAYFHCNRQPRRPHKADVIASIRGRSLSSADPAPVFTIFGSGHPMLMSMASTPAFARTSAACAIASGRAPNIWKSTGCSTGSNTSIPNVFVLLNLMPRDETISVYTMAAP